MLSPPINFVYFLLIDLMYLIYLIKKKGSLHPYMPCNLTANTFPSDCITLYFIFASFAFDKLFVYIADIRDEKIEFVENRVSFIFYREIHR